MTGGFILPSPGIEAWVAEAPRLERVDRCRVRELAWLEQAGAPFGSRTDPRQVAFLPCGDIARWDTQDADTASPLPQ